MAVVSRNDLLECRCRQIGEEAPVRLGRDAVVVHLQRCLSDGAVQRVVVDHCQHGQIQHL
jgi:hypothetical protein